MQPPDPPRHLISMLPDPEAKWRPIRQARQVEIRLAQTYLILSRKQARGLMLELAAFLSEVDSDQTHCVITLD